MEEEWTSAFADTLSILTSTLSPKTHSSNANSTCLTAHSPNQLIPFVNSILVQRLQTIWSRRSATTSGRLTSIVIMVHFNVAKLTPIDASHQSLWKPEIMSLCGQLKWTCGPAVLWIPGRRSCCNACTWNNAQLEFSPHPQLLYQYHHIHRTHQDHSVCQRHNTHSPVLWKFWTHVNSNSPSSSICESCSTFSWKTAINLQSWRQAWLLAYPSRAAPGSATILRCHPDKSRNRSFP